MRTIVSNIDNNQFSWSFAENGTISLGGKKIQTDLKKISPGRYSLLLNGKSFQAVIARNNLIYNVLINGENYRIEVETSVKKAINSLTERSHKVTNPSYRYDLQCLEWLFGVK